MLASNKAVKVTAKTHIKDKYISLIMVSMIGVYATLICLLLSSMPYYFFADIISTPLFIIFVLFLLFPIYIGILRFYWRMMFDVLDSPTTAFYYFSNFSLYKKALSLGFSLCFKALLLGIVFNIPSILAWLISHPFIYEIFDFAIPVWTVNFNNVVATLRAVATVCLFFAMLKYYLAPVIFVSTENIVCAEAIYMSKTISKKTQLDFISLNFSFSHWILLSIFIIPLVFTLPYIITSYAVHCRFAIADYNKFVKATLSNENFNGQGI